MPEPAGTATVPPSVGGADGAAPTRSTTPLPRGRAVFPLPRGRAVLSLPRGRAAFSLPRGRAMPPEQWAAHHALVLRTLAVLVAAVPVYALLRGHGPAAAALATAPLLALTLLARTTLLRRSTRAAVAALALMAVAAVGVRLSGGQTEAHFLFFALLPLAALYAARAPFLLAVGFVAAHHFVLGTLLPHAVYAHDVAPLPMATLHAAFVLLESWACLLAWRRFDDRRERVEQLVAERTAELSAQRDELARLAAVVQCTDDAVATLAPDGRLTSWNPGAERLYGWAAAEIVGRHMSVLTAGGESPPDLRALSGSSAPVERRHRRRDGSEFDALITFSTIHDDDGALTEVAAIARDITGRKRAEAEARAAARQLAEQAGELARLALHDPLTGLANRTLLADRLAHALADRRARRHAVLLVDLDDFKAVNDECGHEAGDAVLTAVARRLESVVRPADTVARLGGDEFVVLMEDVEGRRDVVAVAERLLGALREPVAFGDERFTVGGSVGVALTGGTDRRGMDDLLRDADLAMYVAKSGGKNRVRVFERGMREEVTAQDELVRDLRAAVANGELRVLYQPQVDLRTGVVTGMEALARWQSPSRGLVEPAGFIPAAESSGVVDAIDDWVIGEACRQLRAWDDAGLAGLGVAVNVSARRLGTGDLAVALAAAARDAGVDPARLEIEVPEAVAAGPDAAAGIREVRALGVRVAIDDFGTGSSSLSRLQDLPLDRLKIDTTSVALLAADAAAGSLADAVIALGNSLGLQVVAEGVEEPGQLAALRALGCDTGQGHLFGSPVPADAVTALLRGGRVLTAVA
ncbi:PAS domain S-box-containing protein/diguanylate cyclase (GGDEF) domain-containing protein [Geodermatophilus telluris]|uniref:PAS domain S-box-containing protein/diguanylate cyclase (GGDEF) domain-containing protein n=1 Tax=Geodermatophilus telluris TaxID=1190417 RepID=A0A1G6QTI0_9ACTN|nr:PAS domain S-box-containing protein/diguanylate cyclase (GGDEF) domain-containing protein [Geodermatophilus telluris]